MLLRVVLFNRDKMQSITRLTLICCLCVFARFASLVVMPVSLLSLEYRQQSVAHSAHEQDMLDDETAIVLNQSNSISQSGRLLYVITLSSCRLDVSLFYQRSCAVWRSCVPSDIPRQSMQATQYVYGWVSSMRTNPSPLFAYGSFKLSWEVTIRGSRYRAFCNGKCVLIWHWNVFPIGSLRRTSFRRRRKHWTLQFGI